MEKRGSGSGLLNGVSPPIPIRKGIGSGEGAGGSSTGVSFGAGISFVAGRVLPPGEYIPDEMQSCGSRTENSPSENPDAFGCPGTKYPKKRDKVGKKWD